MPIDRRCTIAMLAVLTATAQGHAGATERSHLVELGGHCTGTDAVILVGGYGQQWEYFDPWLPALQKTACVYGFAHDHRRDTMTTGARRLAQELDRLQSTTSPTHITLMAHSMGGLVSKKALQLWARQPGAPEVPVRLVTFGTPWAGYVWANLARWLPGSGPIGAWTGFPMGREIGSSSPFMRSLQQPLPPHMQLDVVHSDADRVSAPDSDSGARQMRRIFAQANSVQILQGVSHTGFVSALATPP